MTLLEDAVRLGLEQLIIVGRDPEDGELVLIYEAGVAPERAYLMLHKALRIIEGQPLDMEIENDDDDGVDEDE